MSYLQALHAYRTAQQSAMSPRYMEAAVFTKAIIGLKQAQNNAADYDAYADAVKFNQRLWTYIQSNLADNGDQIPAGIRESLLNLSLFIDRQTIRALAAASAESLDALIDINIEISRGLGGRAAAAKTAGKDRLPFREMDPVQGLS